MSRRKAREVALQVLFQLDFNTAGKNEALDTVLSERNDLSDKAKSYAKELVDGTQAELNNINGVISGIASEWKIDRMAGVDRNIVRMAIYEMRFANEKLTPNVVINEAVELAKKFGSEESGRFVNGLLGSLVKGSQ